MEEESESGPHRALARARQLGLRELPDDASSSGALLPAVAITLLIFVAVGVVGVGARTNASSSNNAAQPKATTSLDQRLPTVEQLLTKAAYESPAVKGRFAFAKSLPPPPFVFERGATDRARAIDCLATAAWYEAGNDMVGQRAVIQVILNRLRHPTFPKSVCAVIFEGSQLDTGCQFSFTCDGSRIRRKPTKAALDSARKVAGMALEGAVDASVGSATHYHADYVRPWWSDALQPVAKVGAHIFYTWHGRFGRLARGKIITDGESLMPQPDVAGQSDQPDLERPLALPQSDAAPSGGHPILIEGQSPNVFSLKVDPAGPSGRWALSAMKRCIGKDACLVTGYGSEAERDRNSMLYSDERERPLFLFVRDSASGMDLALWDCQRVLRAKSEQCLPGDSVALARLMRER